MILVYTESNSSIWSNRLSTKKLLSSQNLISHILIKLSQIFTRLILVLSDSWTSQIGLTRMLILLLDSRNIKTTRLTKKFDNK